VISHSAFHYSGYQAAAFYANLRFAAGRVLRDLLADLGEVFDGDPITLPVPADAPPQIPQIFLTSKDESLRMDISLARVDVRWQRKTERRDITVPEFAAVAERALASFNRATRSKPGRVALIVHRFQTNDSPGQALAIHFCRPELLSREPSKKGPLSRPEAFELHAFKRFQMGRFPVNSWVRARSGTMATEKGMHRVIAVEQDLNTPAEDLEAKEFSDEEIREFHGLCVGELETIIELYFPGNEDKEAQQ
jgi:hypothetical protein